MCGDEQSGAPNAQPISDAEGDAEGQMTGPPAAVQEEDDPFQQGPRVVEPAALGFTLDAHVDPAASPQKDAKAQERALPHSHILAGLAESPSRVLQKIPEMPDVLTDEDAGDAEMQANACEGGHEVNEDCADDVDDDDGPPARTPCQQSHDENSGVFFQMIQ